MNFKPTPTGGRIAQGKTPFGDYRAEWDAAGVLVSESCDLKEPDPASGQDIRIAIERAEVCRACPESRAVTLTVNARPVYGVKCNKCGCGNLSLVRGKCPRGLWG